MYSRSRPKSAIQLIANTRDNPLQSSISRPYTPDVRGRIQLASRRLCSVFLTVLLLAAQGIALSHAIDHTLQAETDGCLVCHVADHFNDATCAHSLALPITNSVGALEASVDTPYSQVISAFQARAPPFLSS